MSAIISGRVYWTKFPNLSYQDKNKKQINIKEATAKLVMLSISDSADDYGENSWNSFETLATKSSIKRRSVIRVVRALINAEFIRVASITVYGTNNFSVNIAKLGNPPLKRARTGRPKIGDSEAKTSDPETLIGDSEAKTSDPQSPDPLIKPPLNHPLTGRKEVSKETREAILKKGGVGWAVAAGQKVEQSVIDEAVLANDARNTFEKVFGFGTLPWSSNAVWTKFEKLVVEAYKENPGWIAQYVLWRNGDGKYKAFSNRKIRENPQMFMDTGYPEFMSSKVYQKPAEQQAPEPKRVETAHTQTLDTFVYKPRPLFKDIVSERAKNQQSEPLS